MPRIAVAARPLGIAGFIMMAGLTRPLADTMLRQMNYIYGLNPGAVTEEDTKKLERIGETVEKIKALKDADRSSTVRLLGAMPAYWLDLRGYDPTELARSVGKPMLILQGGRDYQVTTADLENWKKSLGTRTNVEFHVYPQLNHFFFEGQGPITPDEYMLVQGSVAPYVIDDIAAWIKKYRLRRFPASFIAAVVACRSPAPPSRSMRSRKSSR